MRGISVLSIVICISAAALYWATTTEGTPLKIKAGLWEITTDGQNSDLPPLPAEAVARATAEQRAALDRMYDILARNAKRHVFKSCLTQKEIDRGVDDDLVDTTHDKCSNTVATATSILHERSLQCSGGRGTSGTYRLEAPSPESLSGGWHLTWGDPGQTQLEMKHSVQGQWLSADCGSVKPRH
jgi:hypothetical protein